jgi:translation initiation factor IF-2
MTSLQKWNWSKRIKVLLEAEVLDLKSNPDKAAQGTVVEAFLDKGKGYVSY